MDGWIKSYRKMFDNPIVCKDSDHYAVWGYLLHYATHQPMDVVLEGQRITLKSGQLLTSRRSIAEKFSISESKVQRILKTFEIEQQIEQQTTRHNRLITLLKWEEYQKIEQQNEQQPNNNRTTTEQQVNTNNNDNNNKNDKNNNIYIVEQAKEIIDYLNQKTNKNFSYKTEQTLKHISGRLKDGYTVEDFKKVIDIKAAKWLNDDRMRDYLRPNTLFAPSKFESYLNESVEQKPVSRFEGLSERLMRENK